jgi:MFS family permease
MLLKPPREPVEPAQGSIAMVVRDLRRGWGEIRSSRVLTLLLVLSLSSALAMAAPEAVALPYASGHSGSPTWGGLLMAAPILGAVAGLLLIGRLPAESQSRLVMRLALLMPLPLLVTVLEPPLLVVWLAWFACGALQSYMLPLQSAFTLLVPTASRGRVFGLAGALSIGATGVCFLVAGWVSEHTSPAASVGVCAVVTFGVLVLLAARWPREEMAVAVAETFGAVGTEGAVVAEAAPPSLSADVVRAPSLAAPAEADDRSADDQQVPDDEVGVAGYGPEQGERDDVTRAAGAGRGHRTPPGG